MGEREVTQFLSSLATDRNLSPSSQNQALSALLFLYQNVLGRELDWLGRVVRAKRRLRVPLVLSREEAATVLSRLQGTPWLMASLLYGAGLRVLECARLRVQDIDFHRNQILVYRNFNTPGLEAKFTALFEARYVLESARLVDLMGDKEAARSEYRRFLDFWKDADPDLPELQEARTSLAR